MWNETKQIWSLVLNRVAKFTDPFLAFIYFFSEFQARLSKISVFLESTLSKESLSAEADEQRKECITVVEGMNSSLNNMRNNNLKEGKLLNAGLSVSNQSLNDTSDFKNGVREEGIQRSGSLPEINQSDDLEDWQATRTTKVCGYLIKTLFTWSGGPRSNGVSFFCFVSSRAWKQKKPTPLDRGPPLHVNRP